MGSPPRLPLLYTYAFFFLLALFAILTISGIDRSCLDTADSAYLISADAISRGQMPYSGFLAAHPPLLYFLGAPLAWLDAGTIPFRLFSLLIMAGLGAAVWRLALKLTANSGIAFLASAFTLLAPLGIFFSKLFIQDALVALLAVAAILLLLGESRRSMAGAGVLCILGTLTKLTFLPLLAAFILYVLLYRRSHLVLFIQVAVAGSLAAALLLEIFTGGAYFDDVLFSQASKGYSFTNFSEGLQRIWQFDWPLLPAAVPGLWFCVRYLRGGERNDRLFLLLGWLAAGLAVLITLAAEGHDTNLFQLLEPAVALLAAWGIMGLAERGSPLPVAAAVVLMLVTVVVIVEKDRLLIPRGNAGDVSVTVSLIESSSGANEPVLVPGCYALEAGRPVTRDFYDQFLWEEKFGRGDDDAQELFDGLRKDVSGQVPPVIVFEDDRDSLAILGAELEANYQPYFDSSQWPPVTIWLPAGDPPRDSR